MCRERYRLGCAPRHHSQVGEKKLDEMLQQQLSVIQSIEQIDENIRQFLTLACHVLSDDTEPDRDDVQFRPIIADLDVVGKTEEEWLSPTVANAISSASTTLSPEEEGRQRDCLIQTLRFSKIDERMGAIPQAYQNTFSWLLAPQSPTSDQQCRWPDFPAWLKADTKDIYWITGKPGSGKSTLMKYLSRHPELHAHLQHWADDKPLVFASFYFWNAGTDLQKSWRGLLQSLLLQCLTQRPDLAYRVLPKSRWALMRVFRGRIPTGSWPSWDVEELLACFDTLISSAGIEFKLGLFIDGLDEFEEPSQEIQVSTGYHDELEYYGFKNSQARTRLIDWVLELSKCEGIKICVSSRPWNVFEHAFGQKPSLRVHDLTYNDIYIYTKDHFYSLPAFEDFRATDPQASEELINTIISKSDGVFLWVSLVVRTLIAQINNGDTLSMLKETVNRLPKRLENLFESIRDRVCSKYRENLSRYFQLLKAARLLGLDITAFELWLVDRNDALTRAYPGGDQFQEFKEAAEKTVRRRLNSHTLGLLEIGPSGHVSCLHRTVHDWISRPEVWDSICRETAPAFDPYLDLTRATTMALVDPSVWEPILARPSTLQGLLMGNIRSILRRCFICAAHVRPDSSNEESMSLIWEKLKSIVGQLCIKGPTDKGYSLSFRPSSTPGVSPSGLNYWSLNHTLHTLLPLTIWLEVPHWFTYEIHNLEENHLQTYWPYFLVLATLGLSKTDPDFLTTIPTSICKHNKNLYKQLMTESRIYGKRLPIPAGWFEHEISGSIHILSHDFMVDEVLTDWDIVFEPYRWRDREGVLSRIQILKELLTLSEYSRRYMWLIRALRTVTHSILMEQLDGHLPPGSNEFWKNVERLLQDELTGLQKILRLDKIQEIFDKGREESTIYETPKRKDLKDAELLNPFLSRRAWLMCPVKLNLYLEKCLRPL
jgi:NACHT domain.